MTIKELIGYEIKLRLSKNGTLEKSDILFELPRRFNPGEYVPDGSTLSVDKDLIFHQVLALVDWCKGQDKEWEIKVVEVQHNGNLRYFDISDTDDPYYDQKLSLWLD